LRCLPYHNYISWLSGCIFVYSFQNFLVRFPRVFVGQIFQLCGCDGLAVLIYILHFIEV